MTLLKIKILCIEMAKPSPNWELYERMIARMVSDQLSTEFCVTPNAHIIGVISKRRRQIDVLIDSRHDTDNSRRIIIDAKIKNRKIDINDVEALLGLMEDVEATHGYLICPAGYTKAAERRAQEVVSIRIIPLDRLENFDPSTWPACMNTKCKNGRIFWDGYPVFLMTILPWGERETKDISYIHYVGKCDRCGRFHVKCLTCGDLLSPRENCSDDIGHQCSCKPLWFWLASIEPDEHGRNSAELHAVSIKGLITVDRRSL